jgi:hypothetical protein
MSLDGFVAGPDDSQSRPIGVDTGDPPLDWYFSGNEEYRDPLFRPETGANRDEVERMFAESGAFIFGRRTYEIAHGWGGRYPVKGCSQNSLTTRFPALPDDLPQVKGVPPTAGQSLDPQVFARRKAPPNRPLSSPISRT